MLRREFTLPCLRAHGRASTSAFVLAGVLLGLCWPSRSEAYCRTRACDSNRRVCPRDSHGCVTVEELVYWPGGEAEIWVDPSGSPLWNLSAEDTQAALKNAIEHWTSVTCPDGRPLDLTVSLNGILPAAPSEEDNVLRFVDEDSPYPADVIAMTLIQFLGAELQQGDIELNSEHHQIVLSPESANDADLEAVLTHEFGHFLGLDHSDVPGATMQPEAMGFGSIDLRSLEPDDVEGICAIYGQGLLPEEGPEPTPAASSDSGCSVTPGKEHATTGWPWLLLLSSLFLTLIRRSPAPSAG